MAVRPRAAAARLALELALWFAAPAVFLALYTRSSPGTSDAVLPHLRLVLVAWLCLALARLALAWCVSRRLARALSALFVATAIVTLIVYYAAVLIGLHSWGRVISWDLIRSYALQAGALSDALGVPIGAVAAALLVVHAAVFAAVWLHAGAFGWIGGASQALSRPLVALIVVAGAAGCAAEIYRFLAYPPIDAKEPVSLTFFPFGVATLLQNVAIDPMRAERLDALEDAARSGYTPNAAAARRNVILIVVDALRPDRMGVYGYARGTTPNLDRLAAAGNARKAGQIRAACSASVCGLVSLLTSKFVHEFSSRPFSLQEVLQLHGYRIRMILGGDHSNFYGLRHFFGRVDEYFDASLTRARYMNDDRLVLERAAELPPWDGVPEMIQFHLMSTHVLGKRQEAHSRFAPAASYVIPANRHAPLADNYYDNGVVQADAVIAELIETLRRKSYLRDALVIVTADHGESLGEGGRYSHAQSVAEEALRIPLLLLAYGSRAPAPWRAHAAASQVDIAPTLLAELDMPRPRTWSGTPLQETPERPYLYFQEAYAAGLIDRRRPQRVWKYWVDSKGPREFAFDLSADPGERVNLIDAVPEALKREWRLEYLRFQPGGTGVETTFSR